MKGQNRGPQGGRTLVGAEGNGTLFVVVAGGSGSSLK